MDNCKTLKSNKERPTYQPYHIKHLNSYLTVVSNCCKELHVTGDSVPWYISDKGLWNNLKPYWRMNFFTNVSVRVLMNLRRSYTYIYLHITGVRVNSVRIQQISLKSPSKKLILAKLQAPACKLLKKDSFTDNSLGKYELRRFNYKYIF